jgi:hypothetical protein
VEVKRGERMEDWKGGKMEEWKGKGGRAMGWNLEGREGKGEGGGGWVNDIPTQWETIVHV